MARHKRVSFGSSSSAMETWISDSGVGTQHVCGDVRQTIDEFWEETMTSSGASQEAVNHAPPRRHVIIGNSSIVQMTSAAETPDKGTKDIFHGNRVVTPIARNTSHTSDDQSLLVTRFPGLHMSPSSSNKAGYTRVRQLKEKYGYHPNMGPIGQTESLCGHLPVTRDQACIEWRALEPPGHQDFRFLVDSFTGWPILRSESLESRDNPFLPDGELCREAEDLLSRATIIRDSFHLNKMEKLVLLEAHQQLNGRDAPMLENVQCSSQSHETSRLSGQPCLPHLTEGLQSSQSSLPVTVPTTSTNDIYSRQQHAWNNNEVGGLLTSVNFPTSLTQADITTFNAQADITTHNIQADIMTSDTQADVTSSDTQADITSFHSQSDITSYHTQEGITSSHTQADIMTTYRQADITSSYRQADIITSYRKLDIRTSDTTAANVRISVHDEESQSGQSHIWNGSEAALILGERDLQDHDKDNKRRNKCCSLM